MRNLKSFVSYTAFGMGFENTAEFIVTVRSANACFFVDDGEYAAPSRRFKGEIVILVPSNNALPNSLDAKSLKRNFSESFMIDKVLYGLLNEVRFVSPKLAESLFLHLFFEI